MLGIFRLIALIVCDLFVARDGEDPDGDSGEVLGISLLFLTHCANVAFVLIVFYEPVMDALARSRNGSIVLVLVPFLPYYLWVRRQVHIARNELAENDIASVTTRARWRLPALIYLFGSWTLFVGAIAYLAARK